jgi:hypothetical protein
MIQNSIVCIPMQNNNTKTTLLVCIPIQNSIVCISMQNNDTKQHCLYSYASKDNLACLYSYAKQQYKTTLFVFLY